MESSISMNSPPTNNAKMVLIDFPDSRILSTGRLKGRNHRHPRTEAMTTIDKCNDDQNTSPLIDRLGYLATSEYKKKLNRLRRNLEGLTFVSKDTNIQSIKTYLVKKVDSDTQRGLLPREQFDLKHRLKN